MIITLLSNYLLAECRRVEESGGECRCPVNAVVIITVASTTSSYLSLGHTTPPNVSKLFAVRKMRI